VIVVSGDLANRGRREQIEQATARLRSLGPKLSRCRATTTSLLLPGRFSHPGASSSASGRTTEPIHRSEQLLVVGSTQPAPGPAVRQAAPRLIERTARLLADTPPEVFRLVFLHHHLALRALARAQAPALGPKERLRRLAEGGVDLVARGTSTSPRRSSGTSSTSAPGSDHYLRNGARLRPPRRAGRERRIGLQLYGFDEGEISVETYIWHEVSCA